MTGRGDPRRRASRRGRDAVDSRRCRAAEPPPERGPASEAEAPAGQEPIPDIDTEAPVGKETLIEEIESLKEHGMRLQAEFDNYRKRQAREFHRLCSEGKRDLISELLPVLDNVDRAREHGAEGAPADEMVSGLLQIAGQLETILAKEGLEVIEVGGSAPFDPSIHEAVVAEEREGLEQDVVLEVLRKGYLLESELLRAAMVKVGRPSQKPAEEPREE